MRWHYLQKQASSEQETLSRKYYAIFATVPKKFAIKIAESEDNITLLQLTSSTDLSNEDENINADFIWLAGAATYFGKNMKV